MIRLILAFIYLLIYFIISLPIQLLELIIEKFNMDLRNKSSLCIVNFGLKSLCIISGVKLEVKGYENIPKDKAVLFVGNHTSLFDIIVTYPLMKRPTGYIAKKEIRKVPVLSWWMYFVNCLFLDRENARNGLKTVLKAADMLKSGISVFLFPEGTRSKDGNLMKFKEGGFKIATKSKAPIVPVGIKGTSDVFEKQFPRLKPAKVCVTFGKPIDTADMDRSQLKAVPELAHQAVSELIQQAG